MNNNNKILNIILKIINEFKNKFVIFIILLLSLIIVIITIHPQLIFPNFKYTSTAIAHVLVLIEILVIILSWNFYNKTIKDFNYFKKNEVDDNLMLALLEAETSFNFKFCSIAFTVIGALFFGFYYTYTQSLAIDTQKISLASNFVSLAGNIKEKDILSSAATIEALSNYAVDLQDYGIEYVQKPLNIIIATMDFARTEIIINSKSAKSYTLLFDNCKKSISYILKANKLEGLSLSKIDIPGLNLDRANLEYAELSQANLSKASFWYANLRGAILENSNLSEADLSDANLHRAVLLGANLSRANLLQANLRWAVLRGANLKGAILRSSDLSNAVLEEADLSEVYLGYANLSEAHLRGANLSKTYLRGTNLSSADLEGVDFRGADLSLGVNFNGANLNGANFGGATFELVTDLTIEQLESAIIDKSTKLPPEYELIKNRLLELSKENLKKFKKKDKKS